MDPKAKLPIFMPPSNAFPSEAPQSSGTRVRVFTGALRVVWIALLSTIVFVEIIPIPLMPPVPFYTYCGLKLLAFVAIGYLAPLSFWRFNALNRGILLAAASAVFVEGLQGLLGNGHSFHWYEVVLKLGVILIGFALALEARHERRISFGIFQIRLLGEHL